MSDIIEIVQPSPISITLLHETGVVEMAEAQTVELIALPQPQLVLSYVAEQGPPGPPGPAGTSFTFEEQESWTLSSIPSTLALSHAPSLNTTKLFVNGLKQPSVLFTINGDNVELHPDLIQELVAGDVLEFVYTH